MADVAAAAVGAGSDVNTAGNPTEVAMAYLQDEVTFYLPPLELVVVKNLKILNGLFVLSLSECPVSIHDNIITDNKLTEEQRQYELKI